MLDSDINISIVKNQAYMTLCGIGAFQSIARWLELLAVGIYVFDLTGSPFLVTLVTLLKLARWMGDYYCAPVEHAVRAVLPRLAAGLPCSYGI